MKINFVKLILRLKTISTFGLNQVIAPFTQITISLIIIRYHSTELWGEYVLLLVWINIILLFVSFGSRDFLLKSFSKSPAKVFQLWLSNVLSRSVLLFAAISILFFLPLDFDIQIVSAIWLVFNFINNSFQVLILYKRDFKASMAIEGVLNLLQIISIILMIGSLDLFTFLIIIIGSGLFKSLSYLIFYHKKLKCLKPEIDLAGLALSFSFFIPLLAGTIRSKIDIYYATLFFEKVELGQYQVFIGFLSLAPLTATFFINPYLKNFYRINQQTMRLIQNKSVLFGFVFALIFTFLFYYFISLFYKIYFPGPYYFLGFIFMLPVFLHVLIINELFKNNKQKIVAFVAIIVLLFQVFAGYFLIQDFGMQGALFIKVGGMWLIVALLLVYIKKTANEPGSKFS